MRNLIWVYIDHFQGGVLPASWELITAAKMLAKELDTGVSALVIGENVDAVAQSAVAYGVNAVQVVENSELADYRPEAFADVLADLSRKEMPEVILFPTTGRGRELAGMLAIDLETGVMPDVVALEVQDGGVVVNRPVYGGKVLAKVRCSSRPQIITIRGRVFEAPQVDETLTGEIEKIDYQFNERNIRTIVIGHMESAGGVSLSDASVIVTGGRGVSTSKSLTPPDDLDSEEAELWRANKGFDLVRGLALQLNAAVGATRAAVDAGYISYEYQIGQTGKIVSPDIYIACGISGAIQHLAGMRNSKLIIAINEEDDAPIFKYAHVGVIGDLHVLLPALIQELQNRV